MRRNRSGGAQLRLDGIDTLETHYRPPRGPELHQPAPFAGQAADELLSWLGFDDVQRNARGIVTDSSPASRPGYVLTRSADVHGRCVALAGSCRISRVLEFRDAVGLWLREAGEELVELLACRPDLLQLPGPCRGGCPAIVQRW
ncbi:hypothetical protein ACFPH6_12000 [Streptomyces xiangluensis]|uniref:Uncharacterized protein n=1 Tax=Streptomyces xiangluensis TaxID=2665720 RepID=A0ABV8YMG9_9ACTN